MNCSPMESQKRAPRNRHRRASGSASATSGITMAMAPNCRTSRSRCAASACPMAPPAHPRSRRGRRRHDEAARTAAAPCTRRRGRDCRSRSRRHSALARLAGQARGADRRPARVAIEIEPHIGISARARRSASRSSPGCSDAARPNPAPRRCRAHENRDGRRSARWPRAMASPAGRERRSARWRPCWSHDAGIMTPANAIKIVHELSFRRTPIAAFSQAGAGDVGVACNDAVRDGTAWDGSPDARLAAGGAGAQPTAWTPSRVRPAAIPAKHAPSAPTAATVVGSYIDSATQSPALLTGRHRNRDQPRRARLALRRHQRWGERSQRERQRRRGHQQQPVRFAGPPAA